MAENRKYRYPNSSNRSYSTVNQSQYGRGNVVDGNTAKQLHAVPNYTEEDLKQQPIRKPKKRKATKPAMDFLTLFILCVAIGGTLYTCVSYLRAQTTILEQTHKINKLEKNLVKLQNQNIAQMSELNSSLDLQHIYKVATSKLGMVHPKENQVITFESNKSDYVRQYAEIPDESPKTFVNKILDSK